MGIFDSRNNPILDITSRQDAEMLRKKSSWVDSDSVTHQVHKMSSDHIRRVISYITSSGMTHLYSWVLLFTFELQYRQYMIEIIKHGIDVSLDGDAFWLG